MLLILLLISVLILFYFYQKKKFQYWQKRNVPTLKNVNFIFGDIKDVLLVKRHLSQVIQEAHKEFRKNGHRFGGMYFMNKPIFLPTDPDLLRLIFVKDFDCFVDRGTYCDPKNDPLSGHIFNLYGDDWKNVRMKLTPTFTSGKLKSMYFILEEIADNFCNVLKEKLDKEVNFQNLLEKLGIDIIGHIAFGLDCNTLKNQDEAFYKMTKRIFQPAIKHILKLFFTGGLTNPGYLTKLLSADKEMCDYFLNLIKDEVRRRKDKEIRANDFLQLLIDMQETENYFTIEEIAAECYLFFIAAFETSAKATEFSLYELARNEDLQHNLRQEVQDIYKNNGNRFSYEILMGNKLLEAYIKEALRKFSPVQFLHRQCTKDYKIPGSNVTLEKGTIMIISTPSFHYDEEFFDNPKIYDPSRFFEENLQNIKPFSFIPFGEGPRNCIGMRFGFLQIRLILSKLLLQFEFKINKKTVEPVVLSPLTQNLLLSIRDKIFFDVKAIKN